MFRSQASAPRPLGQLPVSGGSRCDTKGTARLGYQLKTAVGRDKLNGPNNLIEIKEGQESALNKAEFDLGNLLDLLEQRNRNFK